MTTILSKEQTAELVANLTNIAEMLDNFDGQMRDMRQRRSELQEVLAEHDDDHEVLTQGRKDLVAMDEWIADLASKQAMFNMRVSLICDLLNNSTADGE